MKQIINVEVMNDDAMAMLQGMERLHLISMHNTPAAINWRQKYEGAMLPQKEAEIEEQLYELRNAWE